MVNGVSAAYLRLGGFPIGLLLNFGEGRLMDGVKRLVNNYRPTDSTLRINGPLPDAPRPLALVQVRRWLQPGTLFIAHRKPAA